MRSMLWLFNMFQLVQRLCRACAFCCCEARDRASRNAKPGVHFYGVKLVHISWPDADDLLSNAMEFDNEVAGPWPLGLRACLQVRPQRVSVQLCNCCGTAVQNVAPRISLKRGIMMDSSIFSGFRSSV